MVEGMDREQLRKLAEFMGMYIYKKSVKDERTGDLYWRVGVGNPDTPTFLTRFDDYDDAEQYIDKCILLLIHEGE